MGQSGVPLVRAWMSVFLLAVTCVTSMSCVSKTLVSLGRRFFVLRRVILTSVTCRSCMIRSMDQLEMPRPCAWMPSFLCLHHVHDLCQQNMGQSGVPLVGAQGVFFPGVPDVFDLYDVHTLYEQEYGTGRSAAVPLHAGQQGCHGDASLV